MKYFTQSAKQKCQELFKYRFLIEKVLNFWREHLPQFVSVKKKWHLLKFNQCIQQLQVMVPHGGGVSSFSKVFFSTCSNWRCCVAPSRHHQRLINANNLQSIITLVSSLLKVHGATCFTMVCCQGAGQWKDFLVPPYYRNGSGNNFLPGVIVSFHVDIHSPSHFASYFSTYKKKPTLHISRGFNFTNYAYVYFKSRLELYCSHLHYLHSFYFHFFLHGCLAWWQERARLLLTQRKDKAELGASTGKRKTSCVTTNIQQQTRI